MFLMDIINMRSRIRCICLRPMVFLLLNTIIHPMPVATQPSIRKRRTEFNITKANKRRRSLLILFSSRICRSRQHPLRWHSLSHFRTLRPGQSRITTTDRFIILHSRIKCPLILDKVAHILIQPCPTVRITHAKTILIQTCLVYKAQVRFLQWQTVTADILVSIRMASIKVQEVEHTRLLSALGWTSLDRRQGYLFNGCLGFFVIA
ncbi:hypothetical protein V1506DRAFT_117765 [Lipomyces tetrasporus]